MATPRHVAAHQIGNLWDHEETDAQLQHTFLQLFFLSSYCLTEIKIATLLKPRTIVDDYLQTSDVIIAFSSSFYLYREKYFSTENIF